MNSDTASPTVGDTATPTRQAFLFDLDGTLTDSVYQHVLAWREASEAGGINLAVADSSADRHEWWTLC